MKDYLGDPYTYVCGGMIMVRKRNDDWQARLVANPAIWDVGSSFNAAIGRLVLSLTTAHGYTLVAPESGGLPKE